MTQIQYLITVFLLTIQFHVYSQNYFMTDVEGDLQTIEARMKAHQINGSGYVIIQNLEIDTVMYKGYRDKENNLRVDNQTLFQMGSMTGALTKFAIIRLVNDGKINLDAPANDYLISWKIPEKTFTKDNPVSIRDLLTQRRGFSDIYKPTGYQEGEALPNLQQILTGTGPSNLPQMTLKKHLNKDGNSSMVNNMILQQILEDIHQLPFAAIIQSEVFAPLKMNRSIISATRPEDTNVAVGYDKKNSRLAAGNRIYPELGVAGLWSTPEDYAKFVVHLFQAARGLDNRLIQQDLAKASIEPETGNTALILLKGEHSYWGGAPKGFYSQFAGDMEAGWMVIACTNKELCWKHVNRELLPLGITYAKRN